MWRSKTLRPPSRHRQAERNGFSCGPARRGTSNSRAGAGAILGRGVREYPIASEPAIRFLNTGATGPRTVPFQENDARLVFGLAMDSRAAHLCFPVHPAAPHGQDIGGNGAQPHGELIKMSNPACKQKRRTPGLECLRQITKLAGSMRSSLPSTTGGIGFWSGAARSLDGQSCRYSPVLPKTDSERLPHRSLTVSRPLIRAFQRAGFQSL